MNKTERFHKDLIPLLQTSRVSRLELMNKFSLDNRTVTRYLTSLEKLGYKVKREGRKTKYYSIQAPKDTVIYEADITLLEKLKGQAEQIGNSLQAEQIEGLIKRAGRIAETNEGENVANTLDGTEKFLLYPGPDGDKTVNKIRVKLFYHAAIERKELRVTYLSPRDNILQKFTFWPLGLTLRNGRLYCCGKNAKNQEYQALPVNRFKTLNFSGNNFPVLDKTLSELFQYSFGAFIAAKPENVKIRINHPWMEAMLRENFIHGTAQIVRKGGFSYLLMNVAIDYQLVGWIQQWAEKLTPVSPRHLVKMVKENLRAALAFL